MDFLIGLVIYLAHVLLIWAEPKLLTSYSRCCHVDSHPDHGLSRWIVECVSYVCRETLESLIRSNSLSLSLQNLERSLCFPFFSDESLVILE